ncbi:sigma-E processing peptidase SpoIIGA [Pseudogracilibacillus auburnensis]|uniref:Sporulation sigma-E factor-processing peptidase n=1 Tax=Pseudogracilibacillus auburnensis TaxID=1494959 RepID=A0A2V3W487_9BACI|nr:sigma-E processing peptidase SpoIIGA [Pseudogracilibacillus auburnensis]PXW88526.1 sporulation factor SpoIIGA [Pseudogracilibacillus auburnensis]
MIIYLDIILLFNLFCNLLILSLTKYLAKVNVNIHRLLFGTIIATALVPLIVYFPFSFFNSLIGKGIYSLFIIFCTFGFKSMQQMFKKLFLFYFISFSIGGGLFGIHYLVQDSFSSKSNKLLLYVNNVYGDQMSLLIILVGFPLVWLFTKSRMDRHVKDKIKYDQMYDVTIEMNGFRHQTIGYIDSGNHLVDPLTNRPVVLCDELFLQQFFAKADWNKLYQSIALNKLTDFPESMEKRLFIVPFQGVGGNNNYLYTIKPDKLIVHYNNELIETTNVLIGIQLNSLTVDNSYHCLLHPQIIHFSAVKTA